MSIRLNTSVQLTGDQLTGRFDMMQASGSGAAQRSEASTSTSLSGREQSARLKLGDRGYARFEAIKKGERQRGKKHHPAAAAAATDESMTNLTSTPPSWI